ncbi:hypothetical protein ILUMI_13540 [Ignelater luminosus]|uniref:Uncharacterized protein n=1 Tax=Ignelater luminosus TaxID=2038154 RepID=A0A8K0GAT7_IGNLU|nr:hypothetical protein ILUMI_13540 [Ignelater luminosus]
MKKEQKKYAEETKCLRAGNKEMKKTMNKMEKRLERLENKKRRNNVVLQGLTIDTDNQNDLKKTMENFIGLNVEVEVVSVAKLGDRHV